MDITHSLLLRFTAGVLPGLIILLLIVHIYLFGGTASQPDNHSARRDAPFWPDRVLKDAVACLAVLAVVLFLVVWPRLKGMSGGADLGAPADRTLTVRRAPVVFPFPLPIPEVASGGTEIWGAIIVPSFLMLILVLMPISATGASAVASTSASPLQCLLALHS